MTLPLYSEYYSENNFDTLISTISLLFQGFFLQERTISPDIYQLYKLPNIKSVKTTIVLVRSEFSVAKVSTIYYVQ